MQIPALLLLFAIILYIKHNSWKIKKFIRDVGFLWAIGISIIYIAIGAWIFSGDHSINPTTLFLALMIWVLFDIYDNTNSVKSGHQQDSIEPNINSNIFYDVVSRELMAMREQLTRLAINQDSLGWDKYFRKEFIYKMQLYTRYRNHYIGDHYTPPTKEPEWGGIILIVGEDIFGNIDHSKNNQMNFEKLCILHKRIVQKKREQFHKGNFIELYLEEKGVYEDSSGMREPLRAEILSIKKDYDIFYVTTKITLKIDLNSNRGAYPGGSDPEPEYITRIIELMDDEHHYYVCDNELINVNVI
jgi:hypothetical protein